MSALPLRTLSGPTRTPYPLSALLLVFGGGGVAVVLAFFARGDLPPVGATVAASCALFALTMWRIRLGPLSLLARVALLIYFAPLLPTVGYLFAEHYYWWPKLSAVALQSQPRVTEIMTAIGLVGLIGLATGLLVAGMGRAPRPRPVGAPALGLFGYALALAAAFVLSWLSAPAETILVARYALDQSAAPASRLHFDSSFLFGYILLCLLLVDADLDIGNTSRRWAKLLCWLAITGYIVVVHQVLRGDRECAGLLAGVFAYWVTGVRAPRVRRRRMVAVVAVGAMAALVFVGLQVTRQSLSLRPLLSPLTLLEGATHGTWTAVLLTDLSLANRFHIGLVEFEGGRTYRDYALSLPPGFLADRIGWRRPLENTRGPGWLFSDVSAGGCHLPIVPFLNFGWWGVFFILALYGWILGRVDRGMAGEPSRARRFAYVAAFTFIPLWFWYGDMSAIRGAMIIGLCWGAYRLAIFLRSRRFLPSA